MRGLRPAPIQPMSEAMHGRNARGAGVLPTHEHELQTGGETHETTLSKHHQIPRFLAKLRFPSVHGIVLKVWAVDVG
jgi:hypothetical protein